MADPIDDILKFPLPLGTILVHLQVCPGCELIFIVEEKDKLMVSCCPFCCMNLDRGEPKGIVQ